MSEAINSDSISDLYNALREIYPTDRHIIGRQNGIRESGKLEVVAYMPKDSTEKPVPFTRDVLEEHLSGSSVLAGLHVNVSEGFARSLTLDIDVYDGSVLKRLPEMLTLARSRGWPLVPIRSKSGGLHLSAYLSEETPFETLRTRTRELVALLGLPEMTERFPKAPTLSGSALWLPYWRLMSDRGSESGMLRDNGSVAPVAEWAEQLRRTRATVGAVMTPIALASTRISSPREIPREEDAHTHRELFPDGPPCLQAIEHVGAKKFSRDIALATATYHQIATLDPTETERRTLRTLAVLEANLTGTEISQRCAEATKRFEKGDLRYLCNQQPLSDHCRRDICKTRRLGVESTPGANRKHQSTLEFDRKALALRERLGGEGLELEVLSASSDESDDNALGYRLRIGVEPPLVLEVPNSATLYSVDKMQMLLHSKRRGAALLLDNIEPKTWKRLMNLVDATRVRVEISSDADPMEATMNYIVDFAEKRSPRSTLEEVAATGGWTIAEDKGQLRMCYRAMDMEEFLNNTPARIRSEEGRRALTRLSARRITKRIKHRTGKSYPERFSTIPIEFISERARARFDAIEQEAAGDAE